MKECVFILTIATIGHDDRYSAEQSALMLLPRDVLGDCVSALTVDRGQWVVTTSLEIDGRQSVGVAGGEVCDLSSHLGRRVRRELVRESFYRAYVAWSGVTPVWGSLSGVKPVKIASRLFRELGSEDAVTAALQTRYHLSAERTWLAMQAADASSRVRTSLCDGDISLYVSIPFCPSRCGYCSFVSQSTQREGKLLEPYLACLKAEMERVGVQLKKQQQRILHLYIGGGTPTVLTAAQLDDLLAALAKCFDLSALKEYTVEAGRPDTVTVDKLRVLKSHGVDRVSVNPQSMSQAVLDACGRGHTVSQTLDAVAMVRRVGFRSLNMDLIAGLPGDSVEGFVDSLTRVMALAPENVTVHTLAQKRGASMTARGVADVNAMLDRALAMLRVDYLPYYLYRLKFMAGAGENVGWCLPGYECGYNIAMMEELHTVLGLGAGAVSKLHFDGGRIERKANTKFPLEYIKIKTPAACGRHPLF